MISHGVESYFFLHLTLKIWEIGNLERAEVPMIQIWKHHLVIETFSEDKDNNKGK